MQSLKHLYHIVLPSVALRAQDVHGAQRPQRGALQHLHHRRLLHHPRPEGAHANARHLRDAPALSHRAALHQSQMVSCPFQNRFIDSFYFSFFLFDKEKLSTVY